MEYKAHHFLKLGSYEKYEWLSLYIMMIKKLDPMNKLKTSTNDCKRIVRYLEKY